MSPLMICVLVFIGVRLSWECCCSFSTTAPPSLRTGSTSSPAARSGEDAATSILKKSAFEHDKKSLLEVLTPNFPSLQKLFEQADCHIRPSTLIGIGVVLGVLGVTRQLADGRQWSTWRRSPASIFF